MSDLFQSPVAGKKPKRKAKKEEAAVEAVPLPMLRARLSGKLAGFRTDMGHFESDFALIKERIAYAMQSDLLTAKEKRQLDQTVPQFISAYKPGTLGALVILADSIQSAFEARQRAQA